MGIKLILEPIKKEGATNYENVIIKDESGYPWSLIFIDAFWSKDQDEQTIYENIKTGKKTTVNIDFVL